MKKSNNISFKVKEELWKNFDVSVVIPFYKKMEEFRRVFPLNRKYFERYCIFEFNEKLKDKFVRDRLIYNIRYNPKFIFSSRVK